MKPTLHAFYLVESENYGQKYERVDFVENGRVKTRELSASETVKIYKGRTVRVDFERDFTNFKPIENGKLEMKVLLANHILSTFFTLLLLLFAVGKFSKRTNS